MRVISHSRACRRKRRRTLFGLALTSALVASCSSATSMPHHRAASDPPTSTSTTPTAPTPATSSTHATSTAPEPAAPACPAAFSATDATWVPARPKVDGVRGRLVPLRAPGAAVVCSYVRPLHLAPRSPIGLSGTTQITTGLVAVPDTLAWTPRASAGSGGFCTAVLERTDLNRYLVGLRYSSGTVWVSIPGNHCGGGGNGTFRTGADLLPVLGAALTTKRWPSLDSLSTHPCSPRLSVRLDDDRQFVPSGAQRVVVCPFDSQPASPTPPLARSTAIGPLVTALNRLRPHRADVACPDGTVNTRSYTLLFEYASGPPQLVDVWSDAQCNWVFNDALEVHDRSIAAIVRRLVASG